MAFLKRDTTIGGFTARHDGYMGDSSLLDADTLDGIPATDFAKSVEPLRIARLSSPMFHVLAPNQLQVTGSGELIWERTTTGTYIDKTGRLQTAGIDTPREERKGWLIEGQSTNTRTNSTDFSTGFTQTGTTVTPGTAVAPDGTTTASRIQGGSNYYIVIGSLLSTTSETPITASVFVKPIDINANPFLEVYIYQGHSSPNQFRQRLIFNLNDKTTGFVGTPSGPIGEGTIEEMADGWFRISWSAQCISISGGTSNTIGFSYQTVTDMYMWGAQIETLPGPTSYIPTTEGPVTRQPDQVKCTMANNVPQTTELSYMATVSANPAANLYPRIISSTQVNNMWIYLAQTQVLDNYYYHDTVPTSHTASAALSQRGEEDSLIVTWNPDGTSSMYHNGTQIIQGNGTRNVWQIPDTAELYFGYEPSGNREFYGHMRDIKIFDFGLTSEEAKLLSGV